VPWWFAALGRCFPLGVEVALFVQALEDGVEGAALEVGGFAEVVAVSGLRMGFEERLEDRSGLGTAVRGAGNAYMATYVELFRQVLEPESRHVRRGLALPDVGKRGSHALARDNSALFPKKNSGGRCVCCSGV